MKMKKFIPLLMASLFVIGGSSVAFGSGNQKNGPEDC